MTRTTESVQKARSVRSHLSTLNLVVVTTYTNRQAKTGAQKHYFSNRPVLYDYGDTGTVQRFWPVLGEEGLSGLGSWVTSIPHVPSIHIVELLRKPIVVTLANEYYGDDYVIGHLRNYNLEGAEIEISQILLNQQIVPTDLSSMAGDEHTVFYFGEILRVAPVTTATIQLQCALRMPNADWLIADHANTDFPDKGTRVPIVHGSVDTIKVINYNVGWATTLAVALTDSETGNKTVTDASGFSGSFEIQVGSERMSATYVDDATLNITARGVSGTSGVAHIVGEVIAEVPTSSVILVQGKASDVFNALRVISPFSDELTTVNASRYASSISDTTTISGETITSVTISQANLRLLFDDLIAEAAAGAQVDTQPEFSIDDPGLHFIPFATRVFGDPVTRFGGGTAPTRSNAGLTSTLASLSIGTVGLDEGIMGYFPTGTLSGQNQIVKRWRVVVSAQWYSPSSSGITALVRISYQFPGADTNEQIASIGVGGGDVYGMRWVGTWRTPGGGTTVEDFEEPSFGPNISDQACAIYLMFSGAGGGGWYESLLGMSNTGIEFELESGLTRDTDVAVSGGGGGPASISGLEFTADIDGIEAPNADYDVSSGNLITGPVDALRYWLNEIGDETVDETSFGISSTNLSGDEISGDVRFLGATWEECAARLAFHARSNLVPAETSSGRIWRLLQADSSYDWPSADGSITEWDDFIEAGRSLDELATSFRVHYDFDFSAQSTDESAYRKVLIVNTTTNDISAYVPTGDLTAAESAFGRIEADPIFLPMISDDTTAKKVAAYYVHEAIRLAPLYVITGVPWWEAYDVEVGDIKNTTPPWESTPRKVRVIEYDKNFDTEQIELRVVEVT